MRLIPSRRQWGDWSLPSKLTAIGALVGVLSLVLYLGEKGPDILESWYRPAPAVALTIPPVGLVLQNTTTEPIAIQRRGDFVLWLPQGVDGVRRLPGRYDLKTAKGESASPTVVIGPGAQASVLAQLHSEVPWRSFSMGAPPTSSSSCERNREECCSAGRSRLVGRPSRQLAGRLISQKKNDGA